MSPVIGSTSDLSNLAVSLDPSTTATITNLSLPTANTEVSHSLAANVKMIDIKARGCSDIKISFTATESGTKYITIPKGTTFSVTALKLASATIYMQSPDAGVTAEILEWS